MNSEWVVAGAEIFLACGTVFLGLQAWSEARAVKGEATKVGEQVALQREQMEASQRPIVVPAPPREWVDGIGPYMGIWPEVLPVKNIGPGAALDVEGDLSWGSPSGVTVTIVPTSLGPGDTQDLRLNWGSAAQTNWNGVTGSLHYVDVAGAIWATKFQIDTENRRLFVRVTDIRKI